MNLDCNLVDIELGGDLLVGKSADNHHGYLSRWVNVA
jgi:hypothetical protein